MPARMARLRVSGHTKTNKSKLNESTVRGFQKKYEQKLATSKGRKFTLSTQKQGRPLMLGKLDELVQKYIRATSNRGSVASRSMWP